MFIKEDGYREDIESLKNEALPWEKLKGARVLITGASGMIGTVLVDALMEANASQSLGLTLYLAGRNETIAQERFADDWNHPDFHFVKMDVNQPLSFAEPLDAILHLASNTHPRAYAEQPVETLLTNVLGTRHLLDLAVQSGAHRFVFLSSVEIYGQALSSEDVFDESYLGYIDCNTPRASYSEGKRAGEALCEAYRKQYGIDVVIPRLSRCYGPTMRLNDSKALSQFLLNGAKKEDIILKSEGKQRYSYCYAADAARGILYAWLCGEGGNAYNVADTHDVLTLREIAETVAEEAGTSVVFDVPDAVEKAGFSPVQTSVMSAAKLEKLGWQSANDMHTGLKKTLEILPKLLTRATAKQDNASGQVRSGQVRSGQVRSGQVRSGQVRSGRMTDALSQEGAWAA